MAAGLPSQGDDPDCRDRRNSWGRECRGFPPVWRRDRNRRAPPAGIRDGRRLGPHEGAAAGISVRRWPYCRDRAWLRPNGGQAAGPGGTDMTVATLPARRVAEAPLSCRENWEMLRRPRYPAAPRRTIRRHVLDSLTAAASGRKDTVPSGSRSAHSAGARRPSWCPITRALTVTGAVRDLIPREMSSVTVTAVPAARPPATTDRGRRRPHRRSDRPAHLRITRTWRDPRDAQRGRPRDAMPADGPAARRVRAAAAGRGDLRERPPGGRVRAAGGLPSHGPPLPATTRVPPFIPDAIGAFGALAG
jgi:hypothetical protein